MEWKLISAILATLLGIAGFVPYIRDMLRRTTRPHAYTWLIWVLTQGIAVAGIWHGGGGWGSLNLMAGVVLVAIVFVLSFRYGTRDITRGDSLVLFAAIGAILVWSVFDLPLLSIVFATGIDLIGYAPSFRKSYADPWGETLVSWFLFGISDVMALLSLSEYNLLTTVYLGAITAANFALLVFCRYRRMKIPEKEASGGQCDTGLFVS